MTSTVTVVCLFPSRVEAEGAVRNLKLAGFTDEEIGLIMQDTGQQSLDLGVIGLLGSLLIPGMGPLLLGGALASTLTGTGIGAATGGLIGILMGLGVPAPDAEYFERGLRGGGILLTVTAGQRTPEALAIIENHGADLGHPFRDLRASHPRS